MIYFVFNKQITSFKTAVDNNNILVDTFAARSTYLNNMRYLATCETCGPFKKLKSLVQKTKFLKVQIKFCSTLLTTDPNQLITVSGRYGYHL